MENLINRYSVFTFAFTEIDQAVENELGRSKDQRT